MKKLNVLSPSQEIEIQKAFDRAMNAAHAIYGKDAFRKRYYTTAQRSLINKALFEAMSTNLARLTGQQIECLIAARADVRARFIELCNERPFDSAISQGTSNPSKVNVRFTKIQQLLQGGLPC